MTRRVVFTPLAPFCLILSATVVFALDVDQIRSEPNLERRAHLALDHASECLLEARSAYNAGNMEKTGQQLNEMQASVELAQQALDATGKDPRRHARPFKMAETETRDLLRRLDGFENSMGLEDRSLIEKPKAKVQEVHDQWLNDIITGKH